METRGEMVAYGNRKGKAPKLSVIIPSYRSGGKLYQAVESVLAQHYDNFELIICDDGSEDFEKDQVRRLTGDRVVKFLCHRANMGTVCSLNEGLLLCEGEWVLVLAADDTLAEDGVLSGIMERAKETEKEWLTGPALLCDGDLRPSGQQIPTREQRELLKRGDFREIWGRLCQGCFIPSGGTAYRRDLLLRQGGFDTHCRLVEDWPLFLKLVRTGILPEVLDEPVTLHRADGVSQRQAGQNRAYQRDLIETMDREILPWLDLLPGREGKRLQVLCRDKKEIYRLRFETAGTGARAGWLLAHPGTVLRRMTRKDGG
jgi:GT2 family glycosyltransferase